MKPRIAHFIGTEKWGGMEYLLSAYLAHPGSGAAEHHIVQLNNTCDPEMLECFHRHAASHRWLKRCGGFPVPVWPRGARVGWVRHLLRRAGADLAVVWNVLDDWRLFTAIRQSGVPAVYYEHGEAWQVRRATMAREHLADVRGIVGCSRAALRMVQLRFEPAAPGRVVRNPVRSLQVSGVAGKTWPADRPWRLGAAGRLIPIKGIALAIQTLHVLRKNGADCELWVAGTGPEQNKLQALAASL